MTTQSDTPATSPKSYQSYLVRLWRDPAGGSWRASAQAVQSGAIMRFGSLQALFEFLEAETGETKQANRPTDRTSEI